MNNKFLKLIGLTLALILVTPCSGFAATGIVWSGNLEISDTYQQLNDSFQSNTPVNLFEGALNLKMELNSGEKQSGLVLFKYRTQNWSTDNNQTQNTDDLSIYQAYLDLLLSETSLLRVGRQKISWGSGFAWNPTNYIGADKNRADLTALNPGVDALDYEVVWKDSSGALAFKPQTRWCDWGRAVKFSRQVWHSDITLSAYQQGDNNAVGIDYATSLGNFTVYTEIASKTGEQFYVDNNLTEGNRSNSERYLHGVIGLNGNLSNNWTLLFEYYYNQEGWTDREAASFLSKFVLSTPEQQGILISNKADLFGEVRQNYLDIMIRKGEVIDDLALSINTIWNLDDQSYLLTPKLEYQMGQNTLFELDLNYFGGDVETEFGPMNNHVIAKFILSF